MVHLWIHQYMNSRPYAVRGGEAPGESRCLDLNLPGGSASSNAGSTDATAWHLSVSLGQLTGRLSGKAPSERCSASQFSGALRACRTSVRRYALFCCFLTHLRPPTYRLHQLVSSLAALEPSIRASQPLALGKSPAASSLYCTLLSNWTFLGPNFLCTCVELLKRFPPW